MRFLQPRSRSMLKRFVRARRGSRLVLAVCVAVLAACDGGDSPPGGGDDVVAPSPNFRRDVDELQRIKLVPKSCETNRDCPDGSRCDGDSAVCTWECLSDSECGPDGACDQLGRCGRAFLALRANDT